MCIRDSEYAHDYWKERRCCPNKEYRDGDDWCKDIPNDTPCTHDWQCESGRCMNRESDEGFCKPKLDVGALCDEHADCKSPGRCLEGEHGDDRCRECEVNSDCGSDKYCAEKVDGKIAWQCKSLKSDWWGCGEEDDDPTETGRVCANQCGIAN